MSTTEGPDRYGGGSGSPLDDGPVIDPRDPLGLGDLPSSAPDDPWPGSGTGEHPQDDRPEDDDRDHDSPAGSNGQDGNGSDDDGSDDDGHGDVKDGAVDPDLGPGNRVPEEPAPEEPDVVTTTLRSTVVRARAAAQGTGASDVPAGPGTGAVSTVPEPPEVPAPPGRTSTAPATRSGWARLGHAMRPRTTQGQLITAGLCALLGFALVVQVRQATDTQLGALRQNDLVRLLDETTTRTDELEREFSDLQRERDELLSGSDRQQAALDAARRTAAMQGILTGRLPATGPGVRITLTEPDGEISPATMLHVLEELRNAGAEAMELNGRRIIASSAFTGTRGAVELDGVRIEAPYRWTVIGDPDTIAPALEIPGGALVRVGVHGGRGTVEKLDRVEVRAVRDLPEPQHASPVVDEE